MRLRTFRQKNWQKKTKDTEEILPPLLAGNNNGAGKLEHTAPQQQAENWTVTLESEGP